MGNKINEQVIVAPIEENSYRAKNVRIDEESCYDRIIRSIFPLLVASIFTLQCANSDQLIKGNAKDGSKNIGYLKLKIIDSVNNGTFTKSTVFLRGVNELPKYPQPDRNFEAKNDFVIQGAIKDNAESIVPLEAGEYYSYLQINDSIVRPLLVSDFTNKTIRFGYRTESLPEQSYKLIHFGGSKCINADQETEIYQCNPLKIEKGKITEITLKFATSSKFDGDRTGDFWLATLLTPIGPVLGGAPLILAGTIIVKRGIEYSTVTNPSPPLPLKSP